MVYKSGHPTVCDIKNYIYPWQPSPVKSFNLFTDLDVMSKKCMNCHNYSWPQPEEGAERVKRCSKCNVVYYCSTQCQEEHWHKVRGQQF